MKSIFATALLVTSISAFASGKLALNVELNPAGSFQATSDKVKGEVTKKKDDTSAYKIHWIKPGSKFDKMLENDPVSIRKKEEWIKSWTENPPPEWILKMARGED